MTQAVPPFHRVLVANRGEIALRIIRACRDLGMEAVAVYSDADAGAAHVRLADEAVRLGPSSPAESYLRIDAVVEAAVATGAEAVHPGYGFLAERAAFARAVEDAGLVYVGPSPATIKSLGDKLNARRLAAQVGVPAVPGTLEPAPVDRADHVADVVAAAERIGFPLLVKAAAGGGGRGMRRVTRAEDLPAALAAGSHEASSAFGDGSVYLEREIAPARHVEVQLIADNHGTVVALGERDCSLQRRHQKLWEEALSPALNESERVRIGETVAHAMRTLAYRGVGTVEFLYEGGEFYFIEMNTRLQVEHTITEMITGLDLVIEQIRIAAGAPLTYRQEDIRFNGHAIECRINAENPHTFRPSPGTITHFHPPGGLGVRVDSGAYAGYTIPPYYDSLIGKLIVHARNRNECLMRLKRALGEFVVDGIETTIPLFTSLIAEPDIVDGNYDIHWLENHLAKANSRG
jgi:acetyl-CoA carboxylase biotin carboxylase subunit